MQLKNELQRDGEPEDPILKASLRHSHWIQKEKDFDGISNESRSEDQLVCKEIMLNAHACRDTPAFQVPAFSLSSH